MKVYRFLATIVVILLIGSGSKINAQEITKFELRNSGPCLPFPATSYLNSLEEPIDEHGQTLPINQCKNQYLTTPADRCGFSAGNNHHVAAAEPEIRAAEIDLSPLRFECMGPNGNETIGIEPNFSESHRNVELVKSAKKFREAEIAPKSTAEVKPESQPGDVLAKEEVRKIIESVFTKELSIEEVVEKQFAEHEYEPYIDPTRSLITEYEQVHTPLADYQALIQFWADQVINHPLIQNPVETVSDQLVELECELCGSWLLNLAYSFQSAVQTARFQLERERELAEIHQNAILTQGVARVFRVLGESLIDVSDSISAINVKKVGALSIERH